MVIVEYLFGEVMEAMKNIVAGKDGEILVMVNSRQRLEGM
jgi:hypothetical protein